jgi:hypothetical protein
MISVCVRLIVDRHLRDVVPLSLPLEYLFGGADPLSAFPKTPFDKGFAIVFKPD